MANIGEAFAQAGVITYVIGGAAVVLYNIKPVRQAVQRWWQRTHAPKNKPEAEPKSNSTPTTKPPLRLLETHPS